MGRSKSNQRVNLDPFNLIVYRLSPVVGSRSEVLDMDVLDAIEMLAFDNQEREREKLERFQLLLFGANSNTDPKARKKYYEGIKPKGQRGKVLKKNKPLEWDYSSLDEFRAK